jgi:omega-6 fatty acid desaturase (delta-12 desaturase)
MQADDRRAWFEFTATFVLFLFSLWVGVNAIHNWWILVPSVLLISATALRIYMIQHDCLHHAFFSSNRMNDLLGILISPIAMTPYKVTRYIHNQHHAHVADLDRRDTFEIYVMTLKEWQVASPFRRLWYRIYRSPLTLIIIGPFVFWVILRRFPVQALKTGIWDVVLHNILFVIFNYLIWAYAGWPGLGVWYAAVYLACAGGAFIPYCVHNFENVHWGVKPGLDFETAALDGSAVLHWGWLADLITMNIAYHDLHHLYAKIPGYKLKAVHQALEAEGLIESEKIGFIGCLKCLNWKLYDEDGLKMVPFPKRGQAEQSQPA